ncbi:MAG TPA: branched-chain amino acid ABC transporter permease [Gaiellaceae bacterium]|nr:branched-chain amino acid ABC transporter permease [Gaiellaceae bacterium]
MLVGLLILWLLGNLIVNTSDFINVLLIGLTNGAVYGLVALGYTLVYGILQLINFAHGDVFALSGLVAFSFLIDWWGVGEGTSTAVAIGTLILCLLLTMPLFAGGNAFIEFVAYRRLRNAPRLAPLITAVGVSFIVQNVSLAVYDTGSHGAQELLPRGEIFDIGGVTYQWNKLVVILIVIPLLIGLTWFVRSTRQGKGMRATAQDRDAAAMMGINVNRTISVTFALAGALAAAGGLLFLLQFNMRFDTGFQMGLIAFTAAVLGGIGNLTGAVVGAVVIGLIESFNEGLRWNHPLDGGFFFPDLGAPSDWTRAVIFAILIAILVFRPEGLLGERTPEGA